MAKARAVRITKGSQSETFPSVVALLRFLGKDGIPYDSGNFSQAMLKGWKVKGWTVEYLDNSPTSAPEKDKISDDIREQVFVILRRFPELAKEFNGQKEIIAPQPLTIGEQLDFMPNIKSLNGNVLYFGCPHIPFTVDGYIEWLLTIKKKYNCMNVVCLGDFVDNSATSRHGADPDGYSPGIEHNLAYDQVQEFVKAFPELLLAIGNHDLRPSKAAKNAQITNRWLKGLREAFDLPHTWKIAYKYEIDGVLAYHGDGNSGMYHSFHYSLLSILYT